MKELGKITTYKGPLPDPKTLAEGCRAVVADRKDGFRIQTVRVGWTDHPRGTPDEHTWKYDGGWFEDKYLLWWFPLDGDWIMKQAVPVDVPLWVKNTEAAVQVD